MKSANERIMVWDPFVRVFHWSLVASYVVAWVTAEEWAVLHERAGYFVLALVGLRVVWGLIGTRYARFSDFLAGPKRTVEYLKALAAGSAERFIGHNPAGGWMIVALLISLTAASVSGIMVVDGGEVWEELHEGAANLTLLLVVVHVTGVLVSSLMHHENLVRSMLTGRKLRGKSDV